jgi:hypothetical protein
MRAAEQVNPSASSISRRYEKPRRRLVVQLGITRGNAKKYRRVPDAMCMRFLTLLARCGKG